MAGQLTKDDATRILDLVEDRRRKQENQKRAVVSAKYESTRASANFGAVTPPGGVQGANDIFPILYDPLTILDGATETVDILTDLTNYSAVVAEFAFKRGARFGTGMIRVWSTGAATGDASAGVIVGGNPNFSLVGDTVAGVLQLSVTATTEAGTPSLIIAFSVVAYLKKVT